MAFEKQVEADLVVKAFIAVVTGSLPKIAALFSRKATEKTSKELRLNDRLQNIATRYAQGEFLNNDGYEIMI